MFPVASAASPSFNILTWTGNGGERSLTGLGFQPDWVIIRKRDTSDNTYHYNSTNGAALRYQLNGSATVTSYSTSYFKSFDADGFSVYGEHNTSSNSFVAWCWKFTGGTTSTDTNCATDSSVQVNDDFNMSLIQTDDGLGSPGTFGHGLSTTPTFSFFREYPGGGSEVTFCYTTAFDGSHDGFSLSGSPAVFNTSLAAPTSTCLEGGAYKSYTAWSFANSDICKIGTYTGTGSSGVSVTTGFATNFVMVKSSGRYAAVFDSVRGGTKRLYWSLDSSESDSAANWEIDFGSNGFTINGTNSQINQNGDTYVYLAFSINT